MSATQGSRSARANILLVDEFRMVDQTIVNTVLKPFLTSQRRPGFTRKPEYKDYNEPNKQMYLSSAWYKNHWSYDTMMAYTKKMVEGAKYFVAHLPYQVGIKEGIYDKQRIIDEMTEETLNEIHWMMEYEAKWFGESESAFFKFENLEANRKEPDALYPQDTLDLIGNKITNPKKKENEIRILAADIALMGGDENDASAFTLLQLKPNGNKYERYVTYMETMDGGHSESQAIRIQQLRHDFDVDYIVLDTNGVGAAVLDPLMTPLYDEERGEKYEPITVMGDKYAERCKYEDAEPVIYAMVADRNMNMDIANRMADSLKRNKLHMLFKEPFALEKLQKNSKLKFMTLEPRVKAKLLLPYRQTEYLTQEMLNLETNYSENNTFSLKEQGSMRKDRYSSISYGNYYASILERENLHNAGRQAPDVSKFAIFRKPKF